MAEEKQQVATSPAPETRRPMDGRDRRPRGPRGGRPRERERDEFDQKTIDLARVTRVMAGGKRMRFRACVVVGDRKGKIGWAVAKGADVSIALNKAATKAKKNLLTVKSYKNTIPHEIRIKFGAARVLFKPARSGTGIKAGGAVRSVLELSGIENVSAKILGSNNKINNVHATFMALAALKYPHQEEAGESVDSDEKKAESKPKTKVVAKKKD